MELLSKGENNQSEIARTLQMDLYRALESRRYDVIDGTIENPVMKVQ